MHNFERLRIQRIEMSKIQTEVKRRRLSPRVRAFLWMILLGVLVLSVRYHREIYVFTMVNCQGLRLVPSAVQHVYSVRQSLLDDKLEGAATQDAEISILQKNLQHKSSWVRSHALRYVEDHSEELVKPLFSDIFRIIEEESGGAVRMSEPLLLEADSFPDGLQQRVLKLAETGEPKWRRTYAMNVISFHSSSFPNLEVLNISTDQAAHCDDLFVREYAIRILKQRHQKEPISETQILMLLASKFDAPRIAGLQFLVDVDPTLAAEKAMEFLEDTDAKIQATALFVLGELDPDYAEEAARRKLDSYDTSLRAQAVITLRNLDQSVSEDDLSAILKSLSKEIQSTRYIGHERMRRLGILYALDTKRAIAVAKAMVANEQLGTLPKNFLLNVQSNPN